MTLAEDFPLLIHPEAPDGDDFRRNGDVGIREDEAVEFELHPALACEATGVLCVGETAGEVAAARERGTAKLARGAQVTKDRIAGRCGLRRKGRLLQCALDEASGAERQGLGIYR